MDIVLKAVKICTLRTLCWYFVFIYLFMIIHFIFNIILFNPKPGMYKNIYLYLFLYKTFLFKYFHSATVYKTGC